MTNTKDSKINISPLPAQAEDYSHFEETQLRWDRIAVVFVVVVVVILGLYQMLSSGNSEQQALADTSVVETPSTETPAIETESEPAEAKSEQATPDESAVNVEKSDPNTVADAAAPVDQKAVNKNTMTEANTVAQVEAPSPEAKPVVEQTLAEPKEPKPLVNPVNVLHPGITSAQLTSFLKNNVPVDQLGTEVPMNQEGIIKVVLYTEMENLKGTWLRHVWFRNDKQQAKINVPVNVDKQNSSSSKFINAQMLGDWRVEVLDEQNTLYAEARFQVVPNSY